MGTASRAMGRTSMDRPSSSENTTRRDHDGTWPFHGRQQITTSATRKTKLNVVSVRIVAEW